jgi:ABC-type dipeptide/oligopeptide/nickel transport system permease component/ABC-type transport system substrate-binding protein
MTDFYRSYSLWLKRFGILLASSLIVAVGLVSCSWWFSPNPTHLIELVPEGVASQARAQRQAIPDFERPVIVWQRVNYAEGAAGHWYPKGEPELLRPLVEEGKLPAVAERVGSEPLVMQGVEGNGRHGGVWVEAAWAIDRYGLIDQSYSYSNLVRWSPQGYPIVPHVARDWKINEDSTVYTFFLRKGMRWSDGVPFTADDIMYWYKAEILDRSIGGEAAINNVLRHADGMGKVEKIDDYTVKFIFDRPNGLFLERLAGVSGRHPVNTPRHYLERYHPNLGKAEEIERRKSVLGLPSPHALYVRLKRFDNPEHPRLWPWVARTYQRTPPYGYVRNPYYFAVDTEGNQLPYIDRFHWELKSPEMLAAAAAGGELNLQTAGLTVDRYTLLMSQREKRGYSIRQWYPSSRSSLLVSPNINRKELPADPSSRWKARLLRDKRFRQALSLAVHRQAIIDTAFLGIGKPAQLEPGVGSPFHSENAARAYASFEPERARGMLDEIGLTQRDGEGMRTYPDGSRMEFYILTTTAMDAGAIQMVADNWAAVGVRAKLRVRSQQLARSEVEGLIHDFIVGDSFAEFIPTPNPRSFVPYGGWCDFAPGYAMWYMQGGMHDAPQARALATQGPPPGDPVRRAMELYDEVSQAPTLKEQVGIFSQILDLAAENVWSINIATPPPYLVLVKDGIRNVPELAVAGNDIRTPGNVGMETFYFENPSVAPGVIEHMQKELLASPTLPGGNTAQPDGSGEGARGLLWTVLMLGAAIGVLCLAVRHPFIARRLALMIPTLGVISILTFIIIQLPPGDYLTTLSIKLQEQGGEASQRELEEFRELFHLDKSPVNQYLRWAGFHWFTTFAEEDRGLIQGDLGLSMETRQPVTRLVGDRIMLTVLISLGTILLTWALAIPIGIYSAVRQYSPGDYLVSVIGFFGMSVPNFLLAILLMYFASESLGMQVTGLFSPEYSVQPGWSYGKVIDLLKHIWVPILILGVGGTAGMVRVMRGNLLDELHKPYVRTARAKGVKPWRLILKYPVRIALNPFISGIGTLFPQLISGGAITAVILSLPTVGPLMLEAFRTEDMYLAGSMLVVLSFLGIAGTLVSDLLLLALDPRIRMGKGGSR